jgi:hypothetical protein
MIHRQFTFKAPLVDSNVPLGLKTLPKMVEVKRLNDSFAQQRKKFRTTKFLAGVFGR